MKRGIEIKAFHAIWWSLAVLLPDLLAFATRDWRAAVAGAFLSVVMMALALRVFTSLHPGGTRGDAERLVFRG